MLHTFFYPICDRIFKIILIWYVKLYIEPTSLHDLVSANLVSNILFFSFAVFRTPIDWTALPQKKKKKIPCDSTFDDFVF